MTKTPFLRRLLIVFVALIPSYCSSAFAKEKSYYLDYYSFGDPLQLALDYAFGSVGYRFTAHPDILSRPWYGQLKGSVTASSLPSYVQSVLSPLGLRVDLGAESVYVISQAEPTGVFSLVDTTIAVDSALYEGISSWCNSPVCSFIRLADGLVWLRSSPDFFASLIRPLSGYLSPVALDPDDDLEAHILLIRYRHDTSTTLGISYPSTYLPVPDLAHNINAIYSGVSFSVEARPVLHLTAGGSQSVFIGQERPVSRNTITESGAVLSEYDYKRYGLTIKITSGKRDKFGRFPFSLSVSSTDYQENGTALISESSSDFVLSLDTAVIVAGVQSTSVYSERVGVPFLAQLPLLGYLFGRDVQRSEKTHTDVLFWVNRRVFPASADSLSSISAGKRG